MFLETKFFPNNNLEIKFNSEIFINAPQINSRYQILLKKVFQERKPVLKIINL